MGSKEKKGGGRGLSRRDFLKVSAAGTAIGATGLDFALRPAIATAASAAATYHTTCPYCSAHCGQTVAVDSTAPSAANVLDIYGDKLSPINSGGLCAKGAGSFQLVTNKRRLGVPTHTSAVDGTDFTGTAWRRVGNGPWDAIALDTAFTEIASGWSGNDSTGTSGAHLGMVKYRDIQGAVSGMTNPNSKTVMFFGCSHMNNEPNYMYRKVIANFGTTNVEHQARI